MTFRTQLNYQYPHVTKEAKPALSQKVPPLVDKRMLFPTGKLMSDKGINLLKRLNLPKGRHHRREIEALLRKHGITEKCPYSIIRGNGMHGNGDALYAVYRDHYKNQSVVIGRGYTSKVKEIQNLDTGTWYVLKVLSNFDAIASKEHGFLKQLGKADHLLIQKNSKKGTHKHEIIMERANGVELYKLMESHELPSDATLLKKIALNILIQLNDLHRKNIISRDVKLENIIVDPETGDVTLIDLGFALNAKNGIGYDGTWGGTLQYTAPEIWDKTSDTYLKFTFASDIYAAGIVLQGLLTGKVYLHSKDKGFHHVDDGNKRIVKQDQLEIPYIVESEIAELYKRMLHQNPRFRPSLGYVCHVLQKYIPTQQPKESINQSSAGEHSKPMESVASKRSFQHSLFKAQPVSTSTVPDKRILDGENQAKPSIG